MMDNDYKKLREIGKGGMATVYLAKQVSLNRLVAIKILKNKNVCDQKYVKRFFREARITSKLNHPNIINIIESNYSGNFCYIVTEYIDGGDLQWLLADLKINLCQKMNVITKIVHALDYAHQQGVVHRDIKPSNILLTKNLEPKLCDFGIATALWGQESRLTRTNETIGTMDYIAPEQKENFKNVDFRADIYSIGVILYQAITGTKPQGAFPPPIEIIPSIPVKLNTCVMKCLQPRPYKRYKNTHNLYIELQDILEDMGKKSTVNDIPPVNDESSGFEEIIEKLKDGTLTQKLNSKSLLLENINENHEKQLIRLLLNSNGFLKETVIGALGKLKSVKSCPYLIELLSDPYYNKMAANAIGEIGCKEAEYKLFNILIANNESSYISLRPLGKLNSIKSIKDMAQFLKSPHVWIREMALDALAMITNEDKVKEYFEEVSHRDENAHIRAKAKKLLWRSKKP